MCPISNLIITEIEDAMVVHSEKGRYVQMKDRESYGLSLCISGQITYTMNGRKYISNQNNAVLLPQDATYSLYGDKEGLFPVINFKCQNFNCSEITILPLENPQTCIRIFEILKNLFLHNENHLKIYSLFYELLDNVSSANLQKHSLLLTVFRYIEENISDAQLSNTVLASKMGISEVYLRKLFIAHQNCTPKQYIINMRIKKSKQMLVDTPYAISTIAEECGFSSLYHFCRMFKQRTGQTPTQYAAANRIYKI